MAQAPRILLVEFLNRDRFSQYRSEMFPFVRGHALAQDLPLRWLAFGFDPQALPEGPFRMALPPAEEAALLAAARDLRPTHVLLNEELTAPLAARLRAAAPAARVAVARLGDGPSFEHVFELEGWLSEAQPDWTPAREAALHASPYLVDAVLPDYACELVGPLARTIQPLTFLVGGPHCLYARPLARNPDFEGLDLTAAHSPIGCSFCGEGPDRRYAYRTPPVPLALKQLRAALATLPEGRRAGGFALWGAAAVMRVHEVFAAVLEEGLPPLSLFVAFRIDELLRKAEDIEALLPRLAAAGHALDLYNIGVENFSPAENARLNKGITAEAVAAAHALVSRWERTWPDAFRFTRHGGYGFIVFTPWTTLEDVRTNLEQAQRLGIVTKLLLTSRLQLIPDRAITLLAARDGLTLDRGGATELGGFDSGCILSADGYEIPWRFRHPETGALYAVLRRLWPAPDVAEDEPLRRRVRALTAAWPAVQGDPAPLAACLLDAAAEAPRPTTADALLDRAEPRVAATRAAAVAAEEEARAAAATPAEVERAQWRRWAWEVLRRLADHPKRLLAGFAVRAVEAREGDGGWGELMVTLDRGAETLRLFVAPRHVRQRAFRLTESLAVSHAADSPIDTPERQAVVDVFARALERYAAARRAVPVQEGPP